MVLDYLQHLYFAVPVLLHRPATFAFWIRCGSYNIRDSCCLYLVGFVLVAMAFAWQRGSSVSRFAAGLDSGCPIRCGCLRACYWLQRCWLDRFPDGRATLTHHTRPCGLLHTRRDRGCSTRHLILLVGLTGRTLTVLDLYTHKPMRIP